MLIDTGASASIISEILVHALDLEATLLSEINVLRIAGKDFSMADKMVKGCQMKF